MQYTKMAILLITTLFVLPTEIFAENFTVQQLTFTPSSKSIVDVDGDRILWVENTPQNNIYLYDGENIRAVTNDAIYSNTNAQIDGDYVVWHKEGEGSNNIFVYKISTSTVTQVTNDGFYNGRPTISNNKIVWHFAPKESRCCETEIMLYDISTSQFEQITNDVSPNLIDDRNPVIDGNSVVWIRGNEVEKYEIYKKDLFTGEIMRLTNNNYQDAAPTISGGKIAWHGYDSNDWEIFLYDGVDIRQITSNNTFDANPQLVGNILVWNGLRDIYMNFPEIYIYDISNSSTETISDALLPYTDGIRVVWIKPTYGGVIGGRDIWYRDVFVKNTLTGEVIQVTNDGYVLERNPFLHGNLVVWVSDNPTEPSMGPNIYIARLNPSPVENIFQQVPEQAKEGLQKAIQNFQKGKP